MSEYVTGFRCGICGEEYWDANETTATVRRKEYKDDAVTTTVWELHVCDKCLKKLGIEVDARSELEPKTNLIEPCPFCGGEAITRLNNKWWIHCDNCTCEIGFEGMDENGYYGHFDTEAEAIAAWNTRAERTCKNISDPPEGFLCSECGWGDFAEPSHLLTTAKFSGRVHGGPNYCPNCGRRIER